MQYEIQRNSPIVSVFHAAATTQSVTFEDYFAMENLHSGAKKDFRDWG